MVGTLVEADDPVGQVLAIFFWESPFGETFVGSSDALCSDFW